MTMSSFATKRKVNLHQRNDLSTIQSKMTSISVVLTSSFDNGIDLCTPTKTLMFASYGVVHVKSQSPMEIN
jgi:hypothetical protein